MVQDTLVDLPRWPSRGNRRKLEAHWLERLEGIGPATALPELPAEAPGQLATAVEQFNRRLFWECHETLEEVWLQTPYPLRFFYHSLIKVAVGFHHMARHNRHGARVKLSDGVRLLRLFQPHFLGVRTYALLADASSWLARFDGADHVKWAELDTLPTPVIQMFERGEGR